MRIQLLVRAFGVDYEQNYQDKKIKEKRQHG